MKDIHGERSAPGRIPLLSPLLHCVAMSALVYLRTSFGLTLYRPRSIFFALSFAIGVLDFIAWNEPAIWNRYSALCIFAAGSVLLYWIHFSIALWREFSKDADADDFAGVSHILRIVGQRESSFEKELAIYLWYEPGVVILAAVFLRLAFGETQLSLWLAIVAPCMFLKELLNHWTEIRREKIAGNMTEEAGRLGASLNDEREEPAAPRPTRVAAQRLARLKKTEATRDQNPPESSP